MSLKNTPISGKVWIVEDDEALGSLLLEEVTDAGLEGALISSAEEALAALGQAWPDLIVCDLKLPGMDGLDFLKRVADAAPDLPPSLLMITAFGTIPKAVEALKAGADDFLAKPLDLEHFMLTVKRLLESKRLKEMVTQMQGLLSSESFHGMYGQSPVMRRLFDQIRQVAKANGPVLLLGESGSGKELVARAVHQESARADKPFLPVNCAGIPEHLLESEFFGHVEGAFSGATQNRKGLFAEASGGTLFLDEISEMPLFLQSKLLRILQDGMVRRLGANTEQQVDVRIIAATNRNIDEKVHQGLFREDLFFRLETFTICIPPLKERGDDIELLAAKFMQQFALGIGKEIKGFSSKALDCILRYPYPGNVRELRNAMERAVTFSESSFIKLEHLPSRMRENYPGKEKSILYIHSLTAQDSTFPPLSEIERRYIHQVLDYVDGNKRQAAAILGIGRRTLYRRLGEDTTD